MAVEVMWLGHASFRLSGEGTVVYIDPWKLTQSPKDADVIIVSHSHYDHCSPEDIDKVTKADTVLVAPAETIAKLGATQAVAPGERLTIQNVTVEGVAAYNVGKAFHPKGNNWIGVVITLEKKRIYYAGDTDLIDEMSDLDDVDLALLPVGGTYTLDAVEAAEACKRIGCKMALPYHWGDPDVIGSEVDAQTFLEAAENCEVKILHPGESMTL